MAYNCKITWVLIILIISLLSSCEETPSDPDTKKQNTNSVELTQPKADQTYWTDEALPCTAKVSGFEGEKPVWTIGGEPVTCVDGFFAETPKPGEYPVVVTLGTGADKQEKSVVVTIKEGFSVTFEALADGSRHFVGTEVSCEATVTPDVYADDLTVIIVGGGDCTNSTAILSTVGETRFTASVQVDGRVESVSATVMVLPQLSGRVYPLTHNGVVSVSGLKLELRADGTSYETTASATGDFTFSTVPVDIYDASDVRLDVLSGDDFYGARAQGLTGTDILAYTKADELGFVLAPRRWQITCGTLAGKGEKVKLKQAFTRHDPDNAFSSFYWLHKVHGRYGYISLVANNRPLPTAFVSTENGSAVPITAADSTAFWQEVNDSPDGPEQNLCRGDLFTPANEAEVSTISDGVRIRSKTVNEGASGIATEDEYGHVVGGSVGLPIDDFGGSSALRHELTQVLGFGEQPFWTGITSTGGTFYGDIDHYSVNDIIHMQVYMDTFDLQASQHVSFGVLEWMQALDVDGLPETSSAP